MSRESLEWLTGSREIELKNGEVCYKGRQVSILFLDFNTDVLLSLHRSVREKQQDLTVRVSVTFFSGR
jgi:hypothetical protein